ncbi:hypothetical protein HMI56_004951 [Coelomomyces lativittatus]|nr:hypothetical protein HMI56_004951 [Coelomomyces lativittatus]
MWLHKIDDRPPTHPEINAKPYPWIQPMMANPTSTSSAFKTFSTVPPKIQAWVPHVTVREVEGNEEIKKIK